MPPELLPGIENKKIKTVVFRDPSFLRQFAPENSIARALFESSPDQPNSGLEDTLWVNDASTVWNSFPSSTKRLYMAGEIFRVIQARLGVDNMDVMPYRRFNITDWFYFGSPLSWSASILSDGATAVEDSRNAFEEVGINVSELHEPGSILPFYSTNPRVYDATLYMTD